MTKIDKHGLKMNGLKKASGDTKDTTRDNIFCYTQISYDMETGDIITDWNIAYDHTYYHDPNIITIVEAYKHYTMQEIADLILKKVKERRYLESLLCFYRKGDK